MKSLSKYNMQCFPGEHSPVIALASIIKGHSQRKQDLFWPNTSLRGRLIFILNNDASTIVS